MVKRKHAATKKTGFSGQPKDSSGSSKGPTTSSSKRPIVEPNEEVERKKREKEEEERIERDTWVTKMKLRVFTCERQINQSKLGKHPVVEAIEHQGLSFFFKPVKRFRKEMVKTFYENMVVNRDGEVITSLVGRVTVEVTPDSIARYLSYKRPNSTNYPRGEWTMTQDDQVSLLTDHPDSFDPEGNGRYIQGKLRDKYRTLNKVVHHNLHPFSLEKTPTRHDGEVLVVFGSEDARVDWALWIWEAMVQFRRKGVANGNVPFPVMITKMCESAGCKPTSGDGLTRASPGPIHGGTVKKSASASKAPRVKTLADSLPTSSSHHERNEEWQSINHARQQVLLDNQHKLETNQRRMKRGIDKIKKLVQWLVTCEGERRGQAYEDPDKEEDSGSEHEMLHEFERLDTEEEEYVEEGDDDGDDA
ncbi:hypothetical protein Vadar_012630 [Vaccinium darrowii]|uniref:Uncharacterized protein n=1 Tax=Vaccinium darrowii TaxID=229202 RepID=A0ACB7YVD1_9ERIC|nr:hypothetical protein Vadar_012630 [Vaccinium darrowii]